jgi:hypothetical protein
LYHIGIVLFIIAGTGLVFSNAFADTIPTPLKQIAKGVLPENVMCIQNYVLIQKPSEKSVACVKTTTAEQLIKYRWPILKATDDLLAYAISGHPATFASDHTYSWSTTLYFIAKNDTAYIVDDHDKRTKFNFTSTGKSIMGTENTVDRYVWKVEKKLIHQDLQPETPSAGIVNCTYTIDEKRIQMISDNCLAFP